MPQSFLLFAATFCGVHFVDYQGLGTDCYNSDNKEYNLLSDRLLEFFIEKSWSVYKFGRVHRAQRAPNGVEKHHQ